MKAHEVIKRIVEKFYANGGKTPKPEIVTAECERERLFGRKLKPEEKDDYGDTERKD